MTQFFICPACSSPLTKQEGCYRCESGHCFDIAKEGYVNLLPSNHKHSKAPGDDKGMVTSRTAFLESGYYEPLRDAVCSLIEAVCKELHTPVLVDSGCGEGYYTAAYSYVLKKYGGQTVGVDLSKAAIKHAAKKCKDADFAVASVYHLPLLDESTDMIVNCFSPLALDEFRRILKQGGYLLYVVPDAKHLWALKSVLYDVPYENEVKTEEYDGFEFIQAKEVKTSFSLDSSEAILSLLNMTPYTWKTPKDGVERLKKLSSLEVTAEFRIMIYKRK